MKTLLEPLRRKFGMQFTYDDLITKYQLIGIVPTDLVEMLRSIQDA
jgi:hypothetical protein